MRDDDDQGGVSTLKNDDDRGLTQGHRAETCEVTDGDIICRFNRGICVIHNLTEVKYNTWKKKRYGYGYVT